MPYFPGNEFRIGFWEDGSLNPTLRISKYSSGGIFRPHFDSPYQDPNDAYTSSRYTVLLYLNDVVHGGETRFINAEKWLKMDVPPRAGRVAVFDYNVLHAGMSVGDGEEKIVLKTDVMVEQWRAKLPPGVLD